MKRILLAAFLATAAISFSCTEKVEPDPHEDDSLISGTTATIEDFVIDGAATKTTYQVNSDGNKITFQFTESDVLRVYPSIHDYGTRFYAKTNTGNSWIFKATGFKLVDGLSYSAFYPGTNREFAKQSIKVDYSDMSQKDLGSVDFLCAPDTKVENNACRFTMKHLSSLLPVKITLNEAAVATELSLTSSDTPFILKGKVDLTANPVTITPEETTESVSLALGDADSNGISLDAGETTLFMLIAPVDMTGNTIHLELKNGDDVIVSSEIAGENYKAGKAYIVEVE
ncbi:MAG: fimbrillin family protein [Bacteroidales bacterium]|nr:fimbrillin family protein [Bacteroidales bacterium]